MQSFFDALFAFYLFDCLEAADSLLYGADNLSSRFIVLNLCYLPYTIAFLLLYVLMLWLSYKTIKFKCTECEIAKLCRYFERYEFDSDGQTLRDERLPCGILEEGHLTSNWPIYLKLKLIHYIDIPPSAFRVFILMLAVVSYYGYITVLLPSLPKLDLNSVSLRFIFFASIFIIIIETYARLFRNKRIGVLACFMYLMFQNDVWHFARLFVYAYLASRINNYFRNASQENKAQEQIS